MVIGMEQQTVWMDLDVKTEKEDAAGGKAAADTAQVTAAPVREDTEQTKRMKEQFAFFGPVTLAYAVFYAFCMFRNGSGITFPFFIAASFVYLCFSLSKLGLTLKRGSIFYMMSMMLLAVSTFCTDDGRIIAFNKAGIFLLMMSLLLKQFYETSGWKLGKYLGSIFVMIFGCVGWCWRPFSDAAGYFQKREGKSTKNIWYCVLGIAVALPLVAIVLALLGSADAVFRQFTEELLEGINGENIFNFLLRVGFLFLAAYLLTAFLCEHNLKDEVKEGWKGEPVLAITVAGLLSVVYLLFSGIQILYLFLGRMQLPEGYTYAEYAREGFFQLLAVSILNLVIVLLCLSFFKESRALRAVLTVMSFCTFIMIASSAMRMIIYIRYYYMTFQRILVLWALALLFVLFVGVVINIFQPKFPLFSYSMTVVTLLYLALSFSHPDYIIARINVANAPHDTAVWEGNDFFESEEPYHDYAYLGTLSADAAPVLLPYLAELGYDLDIFYDDLSQFTQGKDRAQVFEPEGFGYYYLRRLQKSTEDFGIRTYNVSRHIALLQVAGKE